MSVSFDRGIIDEVAVPTFVNVVLGSLGGYVPGALRHTVAEEVGGDPALGKASHLIRVAGRVFLRLGGRIAYRLSEVEGFETAHVRAGGRS